jgi:hypothetical protein
MAQWSHRSFLDRCLGIDAEVDSFLYFNYHRLTRVRCFDVCHTGLGLARADPTRHNLYAHFFSCFTSIVDASNILASALTTVHRPKTS